MLSLPKRARVSHAPDLPGVVAAFARAGARHVVIGGFAVIAHQYIRGTEDTDLLIPDDPENDRRVAAALGSLSATWPGGAAVTPADLAARDHVRVESPSHGIVDLLREGTSPLDFDSVDADAVEAEVRGSAVRVAGLASLVAFKRLAGRPRDRADLDELAARHGDLPILPVPGLDDPPD